jgi:hypothetical protein
VDEFIEQRPYWWCHLFELKLVWLTSQGYTPSVFGRRRTNLPEAAG